MVQKKQQKTKFPFFVRIYSCLFFILKIIGIKKDKIWGMVGFTMQLLFLHFSYHKVHIIISISIFQPIEEDIPLLRKIAINFCDVIRGTAHRN